MNTEIDDGDIAIDKQCLRVREIRAYLRDAVLLDRAGRTLEARVLTSEAHRLLEALVEENAKRFRFFARRFIKVTSGPLYEDTLAEMTCKVVQAVMNLSNKPGALFWETRFSAAFEACCNSAITFVERHNRKGTGSKPIGDSSIRELSLDSFAQSSESHTKPLLLASPDQFASLEDKIQQAQLIQAIGKPYGQAFELWLQQEPDLSIAKTLGVSERTVRNYISIAKERVRALVAAEIAREQ